MRDRVTNIEESRKNDRKQRGTLPESALKPPIRLHPLPYRTKQIPRKDTVFRPLRLSSKNSLENHKRTAARIDLWNHSYLPPPSGGKAQKNTTVRLGTIWKA